MNCYSEICHWYWKLLIFIFNCLHGDRQTEIGRCQCLTGLVCRAIVHAWVSCAPVSPRTAHPISCSEISYYRRGKHFFIRRTPRLPWSHTNETKYIIFFFQYKFLIQLFADHKKKTAHAIHLFRYNLKRKQDIEKIQ